MKYVDKLVYLFKKKKDYQKVKKEFFQHIKQNDFNIDVYISKKIEEGYTPLPLYKMVFSALKDSQREKALIYAEKALEIEKDPKFMKVVATRYKWMGEFGKYTPLQKEINTLERKNQTRQSLDGLKVCYESKGADAAVEFIEIEVVNNPLLKNALYKKFFALAKDKDTKIALRYALDIVNQYSDDRFLKVVIKRLISVGEVAEAKALEEKLEKKSEVTFAWFKSELGSMLEEDEEKVKELLQKTAPLFDEDSFSKYVFSVLKDTFPALAIVYGLKYAEHHPEDYKFLSVLGLRLIRNHQYEEAYTVYSKLYKNDKEHRSAHERKLITIIGAMHKAFIEDNIRIDEEKVVHTLLRSLPQGMEGSKAVAYKIIYDALRNNPSYTHEAISVAQKLLDEQEDAFVALSLSNLFFREGEINKALTVKGLDMDDPKTRLKIDHYSAYKDLLENGFTFPERKGYEPIKGINVGYCLHNSLPYNSGGYATRSHGLAKGIQLSGHHIQVISRLGYPNDLSSYEVEETEKLPQMDTIDGLHYHRLFTDLNQYGVATLDLYLKEYGEALYALAKELNITILHGASNFMNGIAANYAARKLGIKSVYEVRGLWEVTRMSRQPEWEGSEHFNMIRRLETEAAMNADAVLTITQALKDEMVSRGVPAEKITIVSNGVHVDRFQPLEKDRVLEKELHLEGKTVLGFIGSFVQYEGLEYIVEAMELLVNKGRKDIVALMVGDGVVAPMVQQMVKDKKLDEYFIFTGRIPHEEVEGYYSLVDIAPLPRKGLPVCEMVSPLKPFEAMAMGRVVLSSNVAALAEIVQDGYNGMLFQKDNVEDLAEKIEVLADDPALREKLGMQAREWVEKERDWKTLSQRVSDVYRKLLNRKSNGV